MRSVLSYGDIEFAEIETKDVNTVKKTVKVQFKRFYNTQDFFGENPKIDIQVNSKIKLKEVDRPIWLGCNSDKEARYLSRNFELLSFKTIEL